MVGHVRDGLRFGINRTTASSSKEPRFLLTLPKVFLRLLTKFQTSDFAISASPFETRVKSPIQFHASSSLSGHPKPAIGKAQDVDSERSPYRLPQHEQHLERGKETTSYRIRKARMVLTTHRGSHGCA